MQQSLHETEHVRSNTAGRILVVEDDDALSYALMQILAVEGYNIVQAHDYRDALRVLEDGGPVDLLLTDLRLPGVNGFALARMGRMRHHDLKVVYMTGYDDVPTSEAVGPVMYKPLDQNALLRTIHKMLAGIN
jgi:DNA-binding NtrC family response regulator